MEFAVHVMFRLVTRIHLILIFLQPFFSLLHFIHRDQHQAQFVREPRECASKKQMSHFPELASFGHICRAPIPGTPVSTRNNGMFQYIWQLRSYTASAWDGFYLAGAAPFVSSRLCPVDSSSTSSTRRRPGDSW